VVIAPEADEDADGDEDVGDEPEAAVDELLLELQAAALSVHARAIPDRAMILRFTMISLRDVLLLGEVRLGAAPWMRSRLR
jgi:hypothetical protein